MSVTPISESVQDVKATAGALRQAADLIEQGKLLGITATWVHKDARTGRVIFLSGPPVAGLHLIGAAEITGDFFKDVLASLPPEAWEPPKGSPP